jgi:hypothetical protein
MLVTRAVPIGLPHPNGQSQEVAGGEFLYCASLSGARTLITRFCLSSTT